MGSGGVAIAALPTVICLKVPFSDGLGGVKIVCKSRQASSSFQSVRLTHFSYTFLINYVRTHARLCFVCPLRMSFGLENKYYLFNTLFNNYNF